MRLTVLRLGWQGDGIARGPVYVARTLPGEVVEGDVEDGRLAAPRIVTPSPDRIRAPCPHYGSCGGCALMHASDAFVASWKEDAVRAALAQHGLEAVFRPIVTSPAGTRRRATFAARRTRAGAIVGFNARASDAIVENPGCLLLDPGLVALRPLLAEITIAGGSRKGSLDLATTMTPMGADVAATGGKPLDAGLFEALSALAARAGLARLTWNGEPVVTNCPPAVPIGRARVVLPPGAFLQATPEGEAALVAAVREAVGEARHVADLFAGCGTFSLPLAETAEVHAVETSREMLSALEAGWRTASGLRRVTTEARDLFRRPLLPDELGRFDALVIDPPRAGAEAQTREIGLSGLSRVVAVSCNPLTFARDAALLASAGFRIDWVRVVDQFRWSPHVELVASLSR